MGVRCVNILLFQLLVAWCSAKHVTIDDVERNVQNSIRNLVHTGLYSHKHLDATQAQLVHPVKVTRDGELVSHAVDHSHAHGHARARRDLHMREHELPHELHYNLTVDGKAIRLDLRPSVTFITPAMMVERHAETHRTRDRPFSGATACHYTGSVRGQVESSVALSACDGLAGLLRTEHGEYWIEPSNQIHEDDSTPRPHVIFKRSAVDKVAAYHRAKRAVDGTHSNNLSIIEKQIEAKRQRQLKEARDKRRREFLEARRKKLQAMRNDSIEYRRHQSKLRMERRRSQSFSRSGSIEGSQSIEQRRQNRQRNIRRRKRASKMCATKQPPYQWKTMNAMSGEMVMTRNNRNNNQPRNNYRQQRRDTASRRSARSVSRPRHVEVLLVADQSMTTFHNETNLETYLLTIMNIVSSLYMDPSIGNYIKVVVVKIVLLEQVNAADLAVSTNADETLTSFCKWQNQLNPKDDENPHHHDVAILVTRLDICSQQYTPCSTLGVAHVAGMCKPDRSCSVNEDNGIMLAHTITHELGHNFGLYHDTEKIGCHRRDGATLHIMTPVFEADTVQVAWSRCSKRDVTNFLDAGLGECLSDKPSQEEYTYPEDPAGVTFDAETQCHLQFGSEAVVCAKPTELCEILWCSVNNTCKTMLRAAAPGTMCGENMWCQNQTCVERREAPRARDGGWGSWSAWSECSRTCGAGVSTQSRLCNNPPPENHGAYCIGDRSRYKVCNTDPCPIHEPTFREVQCARYNNITYNNETISDWIPYFDQDKPCELHCVPRDGNDVELVDRGFVADGTPCKQTIDSRDMCIAGVCYKVGCDWIVNSDAEEDACGECGGDGSACKTVQGIYTKDTTKKSEFSLVAVIPAGSRNVKIQEKASPGNFISISSARTKKMYLNGAQNEMLTEYFVAGSQAIYERDRDWEKVRIIGPIADDIKVYQRLRSGKRRNPGVTYQYTVDSSRFARRHRYRLSAWAPCNVSCGRGIAHRRWDCYDDRDQKVSQSHCYNIEMPRHEALMQLCRMPPCPTEHNSPNNTSPSHMSPSQTSSSHTSSSHTSLSQASPSHTSPSHPSPVHTSPSNTSPSHPSPSLTSSTRTSPNHPPPSHTSPSQTSSPSHPSPRHASSLSSAGSPSYEPNHPPSHTAPSHTSPPHTPSAQTSSSQTSPSQISATAPNHTPPSHSSLTLTTQNPIAPNHTDQTYTSYIQSMQSHLATNSRISARVRSPPPRIAHVRTSRTHWWVSHWRPCSRPCHMPGKEAMKRRNVYCVDKAFNKLIQDYYCDKEIRPISSIKCADIPAC